MADATAAAATEATKPTGAPTIAAPTIEDKIAAVTSKAETTAATVAAHETAIAAVTAKAATTEATVAAHAAVIEKLTAPPAPKKEGAPWKKFTEAETVAELTTLLESLLARFGIHDVEPAE